MWLKTRQFDCKSTYNLVEEPDLLQPSAKEINSANIPSSPKHSNEHKPHNNKRAPNQAIPCSSRDNYYGNITWSRSIARYYTSVARRRYSRWHHGASLRSRRRWIPMQSDRSNWNYSSGNTIRTVGDHGCTAADGNPFC